MKTFFFCWKFLFNLFFLIFQFFSISRSYINSNQLAMKYPYARVRIIIENNYYIRIWITIFNFISFIYIFKLILHIYVFHINSIESFFIFPNIKNNLHNPGLFSLNRCSQIKNNLIIIFFIFKNKYFFRITIINKIQVKNWFINRNFPVNKICVS